MELLHVGRKFPLNLQEETCGGPSHELVPSGVGF